MYVSLYLVKVPAPGSAWLQCSAAENVANMSMVFSALHDDHSSHTDLLPSRLTLPLGELRSSTARKLEGGQHSLLHTYITVELTMGVDEVGGKRGARIKGVGWVKG